MNHSFNDRVDKVFGSISSSSSSTPWSLTDAQVERRAWNRDDRDRDRDDDDETPVSSAFDDCRRTESIHDDDDGLQIENDYWDIRSSIGLDSTLDNEEEEDAYDKMAEGRENVGDRVYMKDVTDHGPYLNSHNVLPRSVHDVKKDPRANHDAAKTRLKEDDEKPDEPMLNAPQEEEEEEEEACVRVPAASEDSNTVRIKSILKRKSDDEVVKPAKRVRFDPTCKNDDELRNGIRMPEVSSSGNVPDYIVNPSKYRQYDLSHNVNEEDYLEQVKKSKHVGGLEQVQEEEESCGGDLPRSVTFIPRKKKGDGEAAAACNNNNSSEVKQSSSSSTQAGVGIGIAIAIAGVEQEEAEVQEEEEEEGEIMQQDESRVDDVSSKGRFQKAGRRYRSKMDEDDNVC